MHAVLLPRAFVLKKCISVNNKEKWNWVQLGFCYLVCLPGPLNWGIPFSDGIPLRGCWLFFPFFFRRLFWSFSGPYRGKKTPDLGGIFQKHAYWHFTCCFTCSHISLSYGHFLSKNYSKKHSLSPRIVMKSLIGVIFCRNLLMDSLQGQLNKKPRGLALCLTRWKTMTT